MTEKLELYKCRHCGIIVQVLHCGEGTLVCCGDAMKKIEVNETETELFEKHIPVFDKCEGKTVIKVGSELHPMTEEHHIEFIEAINEDKSCLCIKFLEPGQDPIMKINDNDETHCAVEYCNIHGLFKGHK